MIRGTLCQFADVRGSLETVWALGIRSFVSLADEAPRMRNSCGVPVPILFASHTPASDCWVPVNFLRSESAASNTCWAIRAVAILGSKLSRSCCRG